MTEIYRQGDLHLQRIPDTPIDASPRRHTLAIGENSGHAHVVPMARLQGDVIVLDEPGQVIVDPPSMAWRHDALALPAGTYRYWVQREYAPEAIRTVSD